MLPLADPQRLVGRHRQLVSLSEALETRSRLVTLHGPSGVGKSRLASEHLRAAAQERHTVAVDLEDAGSSRDALALIASALEAPAAAGPDPVAVLAERLRELGPATLVLDHVDDVSEPLSGPIASFQALCPEAHLLVTSASPLALSGEHACAVEPLSLPGSQGARVQSDALRLWHVLRGVDPKQRERPLAPELWELLRALSGLPLLIELTCAMAERLTPSALLERLSPRLRELGPAQTTDSVLRAVLDVVWSGLGEAERAALAQCAVFGTSFDREAYTAVYEPHPGRTPLTAEQALERLVQRHLIARLHTADGSERYGLHHALRRYARERLAQQDAGGRTRARHAQFYVTRGAALCEALEGRRGPESIRALAREQGNLLAIVTRAPQPHDAEDVVRHLRTLCVHDQVLSAFGPVDTDLSRLDRALEAAEDVSVSMSTHCEALCVRAFVRARTGALEQSFEDLARAKQLTAQEAQGETYDAGRVAVTFAFVCLSGGKLDWARREAERALAIAERVDHTKLLGIALGVYALIRCTQGDKAEARTLYERAIATHRSTENRRFEGVVETRLAQLLLALDEPARALELADHACTLHRTFGDRFMVGLSLSVRGVVMHARGELEEARCALEAARPLLTAAGDVAHATATSFLLGCVRMELGDLDVAQRALEDARRGYGTRASPRELTLCVARAAALSALVGDAESARSELASLDTSNESPWFQALIDLERAQLDLADLRRARAEGNATAASEASAQALHKRARLVTALDQESARFPERAFALASLRCFDVLLRAHSPNVHHAHLRLSLRDRCFVAPSGERVDISQRPALRRVLTRLVFQALRAPGAPLTALELFAAGWPFENPGEENARLQVYAVLGTLRKLGLAELLVADDSGCALSQNASVELAL